MELVGDGVDCLSKHGAELVVKGISFVLMQRRDANALSFVCFNE